jgi:ATP-dependent DNA helicase RecG
MNRDLSEFQIQYIKGVGPQRVKLLNRIGIKTVKDALYYLPYRYEDRRIIKKIADIHHNNVETISGTIIKIDLIKKKIKIFELYVNDGSGILKAKWFNQPFMIKNFKIGQKVLLHGAVKRNFYYSYYPEMDNPEYEIVSEDDQTIHIDRIVPIYRVTSGLSVRQMRTIMYNLINSNSLNIVDPIPRYILKKYNLPEISETFSKIHFPDNMTNIYELNNGVSPYHKRLSFDEFFMLELGLAILKKDDKKEKGIKFNPNGELTQRLLKLLPYKLTKAQEKVINEILYDMRQPYPMNRLIQGDVGCGKTIVAIFAMLSAIECGYQSALMAPTEILAEQHYLTIYKLIEELGLNICILTGSKKDRPLDKISSGEIHIVVGTHALIQEDVKFKKLGLIVIDEQHRFGVMQRALLRRKGANPDVIVMTATPIPRTMSLTVYGDLDYSIINELPPNRSPVTTLLFKSTQKEDVYEFIKREVKKGRQVYIVYPVIEESEKTDLKSAIIGKEAFTKIFPEFRVGLLHGRMKTREREEVMNSFKNGTIDILVCTTVIEVGVDVPNATLMIIIHAERFGLAQLHQLRGRIGRSSYKSHCILIAYEPLSEEAKSRLNIMVKTSDGFKIAEEDLRIRGPGEFFGTRQSGMPDLKVANIIRDSDILIHARKEAFNLIERDAELKEFPTLKEAVEVFWRGKIELFKTA